MKDEENDSLLFKDAFELAALIRAREICPSEIMSASLQQIERLNPVVNAICTLEPERALSEAKEADNALIRGVDLGSLFGLPHAVKDLVDTKRIRTTYGSPIYENHLPQHDALLVERLKEAGAIIIGKTNVPEFGAGSQTFNPIFGSTKNPYDLSKTCGGSSGGAAVALACGMVPLADGSDLGGSLRNPASFCNVVGFRPSVGRVPEWPSLIPRFSLAVDGPMGRSVRDVALLLSVLAGPDARDPFSLDEPGSRFLEPLWRDFQGTRLAWTPDLGRYPVETVVRETCESALAVFAKLGCNVDQAHPDFSEADEVFQTLRAWNFAHAGRSDLQNHRQLMKDTVIWNIEAGLSLTAEEVASAETKRMALYQRVREFMQDYAFLILPVSQVPPFAIELDWVRKIEGVRMNTYIDWMATCYAITVTGLPAISIPCGFTPEGLPIGIQIVGRFRADFEVLQLAYAFEQETQFAKRHPPIALQAMSAAGRGEEVER